MVSRIERPHPHHHHRVLQSDTRSILIRIKRLRSEILRSKAYHSHDPNLCLGNNKSRRPRDSNSPIRWLENSLRNRGLVYGS